MDGQATAQMMVKLLEAVYWYDDALQAALNAGGWPPISRTQSLLFANIGSGERRPARLAYNLGISRQLLSHMLEELQERKILQLEPDPSDGRARIVSFTKESQALRKTAISILLSLEEALKARLGATAFNALAKGLAADWGPAPIVRLVNARKMSVETRSMPRKRPHSDKRLAGSRGASH